MSAPPEGFDEMHPVAAHILDILAPLAKPLLPVEEKAREVAPYAGERAGEFFPHQREQVASSVRKAIEFGGSLAGSMTSPLGIASIPAGGLIGGTAGKVLVGAAAAPAMLESIESRDPSTLVAALPLAAILRNPRFAQEYPRQSYRAVADHLNAIPSFVTRKNLTDYTNMKYTGSVVPLENVQSIVQAMDAKGTLPYNVLWGTRLYMHDDYGRAAMQAAARRYLAGLTRLDLIHYSDVASDVEGVVRLLGVRPGHVNAVRYRDAGELAPAVVEAIRSATPEDIVLYRGLRAPWADSLHFESHSKLLHAEPGDLVNIDTISSFSKSQIVARSFGSDDILLEIRGPVKRLNVAPMSASFTEGESLTFGKFRVLDTSIPKTLFAARSYEGGMPSPWKPGENLRRRLLEKTQQKSTGGAIMPITKKIVLTPVEQ